VIKYSVLVKFDPQLDGKEAWAVAFTGVDAATAARIHRRELARGRCARIVVVPRASALRPVGPVTFEVPTGPQDAEDFLVVLVDGTRVGMLTWWRDDDGSIDAWYFEEDASGSLVEVCALSHSREYAKGTLAQLIKTRGTAVAAAQQEQIS
jgi:hypothetical protein